jgi:hypothetical protein
MLWSVGVWSWERLSGSAAGFAPWRSSPRKRGPPCTVRETPQAEPLHLATNANIRLRRQFEAADASTSSTRPDPVKSGTLGGGTNSLGLANVVLHKAVLSRTPWRQVQFGASPLPTHAVCGLKAIRPWRWIHQPTNKLSKRGLAGLAIRPIGKSN